MAQRYSLGYLVNFKQPFVQVKELVNLFKTKRINENGAQIIFTAHNPEILDILNPNEVGIVNYRKSKGSVVTKSQNLE